MISLAELIHSTLLPEGLANTDVAENMLRAFHGMMIFDVLTLTKFSADNWRELPLGIRVLIQPAVLKLQGERLAEEPTTARYSRVVYAIFFVFLVVLELFGLFFCLNF